jgi:hypothetical protein
MSECAHTFTGGNVCGRPRPCAVHEYPDEREAYLRSQLAEAQRERDEAQLSLERRCIELEGDQECIQHWADRCELLARERDEARDWVRKLTREERVLTCIYCGHAYLPGAPTHGAEVLTAHAMICKKHPLSIAVEALDRIRDNPLATVRATATDALAKIRGDQ